MEGYRAVPLPRSSFLWLDHNWDLLQTNKQQLRASCSPLLRGLQWQNELDGRLHLKLRCCVMSSRMRVFSPFTCKGAGLLSVLAVRRPANTCENYGNTVCWEGDAREMKGLIKYRIRWYVVEVGSLSLAEVLSQYLLAIPGTQLHLTEALQMVGAKCVSYQQAQRDWKKWVKIQEWTTGWAAPARHVWWETTG